MAFTTPGTAVAGDVLTAAFYNVNVRDNVNALRDGTGLVPPMVVVRRVAVQSVPHNAVTAISFDTEEVDTNGCFSATSTNITVNTSGVYLLTASVQIISNATGVRDIGFRKNGNIINSGVGPLGSNTNAVSGLATLVNVTGITEFIATDIITLYLYQTSGISLDTQARASIVLLGRTS